jgi:diaminopimelate decarboxylase
MNKIPKKEIAKIKEIAKKIRKLEPEKEYIPIHKTPFYLYDAMEARQNLKRFKKAFRSCSADISVFFAVKSNPYIGLLKTIVEEGENLDVSSRRELKFAIEAKAKKIIYTGPAKTEADFDLILKHHSKITVNLESLRELKLLSKMASKENKIVRCGVRICTKNQAGWTKFGIPISELKNFFSAAIRLKGIDFCGIHFHISFNKNPKKYLKTLRELAEYVSENFSAEERLRFQYIDIGGGFYPETDEGTYPWNSESRMDFGGNDVPLESILNDELTSRYIPFEIEPIEKFAKEICSIYKKIILPLMPNVKLYAEPGRFISHSVMHFVFKMIDVKNDKMGITDGGNNMIGWEKYQFFEYAPIFNLSQLTDKNEIPFVTCGPLCTPDDIWGYYMYTKGQPKEGDVICMPFQGAYTYTLAQNFIKEIPPVHDIY